MIYSSMTISATECLHSYSDIRFCMKNQQLLQLSMAIKICLPYRVAPQINTALENSGNSAQSTAIRAEDIHVRNWQQIHFRALITLCYHDQPRPSLKLGDGWCMQPGDVLLLQQVQHLSRPASP